MGMTAPATMQSEAMRGRPQPRSGEGERSGAMTPAGDDDAGMTREGLGAWRGGGAPAHSADPTHLWGRWLG
jgi:hypothetical protein